MGPLLTLKASFGKDIGDLVMRGNIPQADSGISLKSFQKPVKGDPLGSIAMFENRGSAFDDCGNDRVAIFEDQ